MRKDDFYQIADEVRALASVGLRYCENGYDRERYGQLLKISARLLAALDGGEVEDILAEYTGGLAHMSPILCVEAVVFRDGQILLIQRSDDHQWAIPGGLAEVGESAAQAAERELWEEAGMHGRAERLLALYDTRYWPARTRTQLCIHQFLVESDGNPALHTAAEDELSPHAEALDVGFFSEDALPELSFGHDQRIAMAFKLARGEIGAPHFDR